MLGLLSPSSMSCIMIAVISRMHGAWWESSIGVTSTLAFLGLAFSSLATSSSGVFSVNSSNGVWGIAYLGSVVFLLEAFMCLGNPLVCAVLPTVRGNDYEC